MSDQAEPCRTLVETLLSSTNTPAELPASLPCTPLDLLIALHHEVRNHMLSDLPRAARAGNLARRVAEAYPNDPLHWAQAHWSQGSAILYLPDYAGALTHYDAALAAYAEAVRHTAPQRPRHDVRAVHIVRVFCLSELGRYHEALDAVAAAQSWLHEHTSPDPYSQLTLLLNRSQLAGTMGHYTDMLTLADETIQLAVEIGFDDRAAQGWLNRGNACIMLGRYQEAATAIDHALLAAELAEESLTIARARVCRVWLLQQQGQLFEALVALRTVTPDFAQAPGERATLLLEEATIAAQLQQFPEALQAARQAARLFEAQHMLSYCVDAAIEAARVALHLGQLTTAQQLLSDARLHLPEHGHDLFEARIVLIEALIAIQQAARLSQTARRRLLRSMKKAVTIALEHIGAAPLGLLLADGQLTSAALDQALASPDAAIAQYQQLLQHQHPGIRISAHGELGRLLPAAQSLPFLREATRLVVEQRRTLPMEEIQARYSSEHAHYHMQLAITAYTLHDMDQMLVAIWEAKAGAMLDLRTRPSHDQVFHHDVIDRHKAELARLQRLVEEQMRMASHARALGHHEAASYHLEQFRQSERALAHCAEELTATARILADRKGWQTIPSIATLQHLLKPNMAVLEWFQVDDIFYAIWITADQAPQVVQITDIKTVAGLLDRWNLVSHHAQGSLQIQSAAMIQQVLQSLSELLLGQWHAMLASLSEIIIAPWSILYQLPWVALVYEQAEHVVVTLTPCAGLWAAEAPQAQQTPGSVRVLGFRGEGASQLAYLDQELAAIAQHVPEAQIVDSAIAADLQQAIAPRILHIAAHGSTNPTAPLCSTLQLADGPFLLLEAHRLELHGTELVVLSACETSTMPDRGDMVLALAGAFLCAGAQAVIASLWRVNDQATALLMDKLYEALAQGVHPAQALHTAQHAIRQRYPLDWAAFQYWAGSKRKDM